jgi:hypothetical protein
MLSAALAAVEEIRTAHKGSDDAKKVRRVSIG